MWEFLEGKIWWEKFFALEKNFNEKNYDKFTLKKGEQIHPKKFHRKKMFPCGGKNMTNST